jgi:hypothetical protein
MASPELSECTGCGLQKIRQDQKHRLRSPAISVSGTELAHKTLVCGSCAKQTRATESRSAARHAWQTCAPGQEQRVPSKKQQRSEQTLWEEAYLAFEDALPALAGGVVEVDGEREERKRWRPPSLKAPPNRQTVISSVEAVQLVQGLLRPGSPWLGASDVRPG